MLRVVAEGTASDLRLAVQPSSSALTGVPFLVQQQVQVADNSGNPVPQSGIPITAELAAGSGGLSRTGAVIVTAPTNPNLAPPGHYTLFVMNRNGVPSVGEII